MNALFNHCLGAATSSLFSAAIEEGIDGSVRSLAKRALLGVAVLMLAKGAYQGLKKLVSYFESHPAIIREGQSDNEEVVFRAASQCGYFLRDASPRLQDSYRIVIAAVRNAPLAVRFASFRLRSHPEVLREAASLDGRAIAYATAMLNDRIDIFLIALRNRPEAFYSFPRNLQAQIRDLLWRHEIDIDQAVFSQRLQNRVAVQARIMQILEGAVQQGVFLRDDEKEAPRRTGILPQGRIAPNSALVGYTREYA